MMAEGLKLTGQEEDNDQSYLMAEMLDFDRACGVALDFAKADGNTLVVITGDHGTGGIHFLDGDLTATVYMVNF
ncbi:MAG: alkaline phosphatase [Bacteroidales bacterium]